MNYDQIRIKAVERQAEYSGGAADSVLNATFNESTYYSRITEIYRDLIDEIANEDTTKLEVTTTMTYTSGSESVAMPAAVQHRPLLGVYLLVGSTGVVPIAEVTRNQYDELLRETSFPSQVYASAMADFVYCLNAQQTELALLPRPTGALSLRLRYVAGLPTDLTPPTRDASGNITVVGDSGSSPTLLPLEHHATLALGVALSFRNEVDGNPNQLLAEYAAKKDRLLKWAARSPQTGSRTVREI